MRVPASTSNLGPGFDCLGLALQLYNTVEVRRDTAGRDSRAMVAETARHFFDRTRGRGVASFPFNIAIQGDVPVSRGLGSSVTVRLGILLGLAELIRDEAPIAQAELLRWLIELEGHPDNAVASFWGGLAVCSPTSERPEDGFGYARVEVKSELAFVALIPELKLSTEKARALLPREIPLRQAVENAQRTARIAAIFCAGDYEALRGQFSDHFHQPFRKVLIPGFADILGAARESGALGSFLSGAGSSMMALTLGCVEEISAAMTAAAKENDLPSQVLVLRADNHGAQVIEAE